MPHTFLAPVRFLINDFAVMMLASATVLGFNHCPSDAECALIS